MYTLNIRPTVEKKFLQLKKKDTEQLRRIRKKLTRIIKNPYQFKKLKGDLHGCRRIHIKPYVLIYEISERNKTITLTDYEHHDNIY